MEHKEKNIRLAYLVLIAGSLLFLIFPFWIPIIFAATISLTLHPFYSFFLRKGLGKKTTAALLTAFFAIVISIPLSFFIFKGSTALTEKLEILNTSKKFQDQGVQEIVSTIREDFVILIKKYSIKYNIDFLNDEKIDEYLGKVINYLLQFFRQLLASLPTLSIMLVIMILCTYSFLTHSGSIRSFFQKILGFSDRRMNQLVHIFIKDTQQVYLSNILTGSIQSIIVASGVSLLKLGEFFLVFFVTLILSFIPVVGAAPVAFLFSFIAFLKETYSTSIILLVLGLITGVVDNVLRPWLSTFGESRIPPIVAFVCVIGGALWLGFPGLFIGLLIGSIAYDTLPLFWNSMSEESKDLENL